MPGALNEGKVFVFLHVVNAFGGEFTDPFWKEMGVILYPGVFGVFSAKVNYRLLIGYQLPLKAHFAAIDIEALDVLAGNIK